MLAGGGGLRRREKRIPFGNGKTKGQGQKRNTGVLPHSTSLRGRVTTVKLVKFGDENV